MLVPADVVLFNDEKLVPIKRVASQPVEGSFSAPLGKLPSGQKQACFQQVSGLLFH